MNDKTKNYLVRETESQEQKDINQVNRRKTVLVVAKHSKTAVEFVETIGVLGLDLELEELLQDREDLRTAVTKARMASPWASVLTISIEED